MGSQAGGGQDMTLSVRCSGARGTEQGRSGQGVLRQKLNSSLAFQLTEEGSQGGEGGVVATDLEWLWGMGCADRTVEEALVLSRNKCRKPGGRGSLDSQEKWSVWSSSQLLTPGFPFKCSPVLGASKEMDPGRLGRFGITTCTEQSSLHIGLLYPGLPGLRHRAQPQLCHSQNWVTLSK